MKLIGIFAALCLCFSAQSQTTFTPGVTFTDGQVTALVMGPALPCPLAFNWEWCAGLNTNQYIWVYASTTDLAVNRFEATATYASASASGGVATVTGACDVAPGGTAIVVLTLPYPAVVVRTTVHAVVVKQTSAVEF